MISVGLARRLLDSGLVWSPLPGDRFVVDRPGVGDDVFHLADMTVEVHEFVGGSVIGFNGVAEWALDSVESAGVVWMPREEQLRDLMGDYFLSLDASGGGFVVTVSGPGKAHHTEAEADAADAYARALLYVLQREPAAAAASGVSSTS